MSALMTRINRISRQDRRFILTVALSLAAWTAELAIIYAAAALNKAANWLPAEAYGRANIACWALIIVAFAMLPLPFAISHYGLREYDPSDNS